MKLHRQFVVFGAAIVLVALPSAGIAHSTNSVSCGAVKHVSGNGGKSLGSLAFPHDSTLTWTNDGAIFQIFSSASVLVNSHAHRGAAVIDKGVQHDFQINAVGNWHLTFTPRCAPATAAPSRFSGNGGKGLGTIRLSRQSVLSWTNDGPLFQIFANGGVPVNSQAHRGTTVLDAGSYTHFQVNAVGNWTISIKAK
jgi:hypothetical protein